ncbi:hypothetical protein, partial [Pannonibacter indicus]
AILRLGNPKNHSSAKVVLSHVTVGRKTPLALAHFGFGKDGKLLADSALPVNLTADWLEQ